MLEVPTDRSGLVEKGLVVLADFAGGLDAEHERDRQGARRRPRGMAPGPGRELAPAAPAVPDPHARLALRGAAAHRRSRRHPDLRPGAAARVRPRMVSAGADGRRRRRRRRSGQGRALDPGQAGGHPGGGARTGASRLRPPPPSRRRWSASPPIPKRASPACPSSSSTRRLPEGSVGDYRRSLVETLFHSMVNSRLAEMARRGDAPFLGASSSSGTHRPQRRHRSAGRGRGRRQHHHRPARPAHGSGARAPPRLRRRRARSRPPRAPGPVRARLAGARQEREQLLRPGVRVELPDRRAQPRHRRRAGPGAAVPAHDHARRGPRRHPAGTSTRTAASSWPWRPRRRAWPSPPRPTSAACSARSRRSRSRPGRTARPGGSSSRSRRPAAPWCRGARSNPSGSPC